MAATYEPIATNTLSTSASSVTFSSISSAFTDLVFVVAYTNTTNVNNTWLRVGNGSVDTGSNYSATILEGTGTVAQSSRRTNDSLGILLDSTGNNPASGINLHLIYLMNYANTTTHKTILARKSKANSEALACVGLWRSTSAINIITIYPDNSQSFASGSTFTLYGIKAA